MYEELRKASIEFCRKREYLIDKDGVSFDTESFVALDAFAAGAEWMLEYIKLNHFNP